MKIIAPSILSADFSRLGDEIRALEQAGADWIHIDIMDGHFVPNITIGPPIVAALRKVTKLPFDVHLMIEKPEKYIQAFVDAGSDVITVHAEVASHLHRTVGFIREAGVKAGVTINPATPLMMVEPILPDSDLLLIMSVNPGFGGQKFIKSALTKIGEARTLIDRIAPGVLLEVDGGVTQENIRSIADAGVDVIVAGAAVFAGGDYHKTIQAMKNAIKG